MGKPPRSQTQGLLPPINQRRAPQEVEMVQHINDVEKTDEEYEYYDNDRQYNLDDSQIESSNLYTGR